jgi:transcription initiation factor TFIIF subunit beta
MERWEKVSAPDVHLATMRVFNGGSKIALLLPHAPQLGNKAKAQPAYPSEGLMTEYTLDVVNPGVENQVVVSERPTNPPIGRASMHFFHTALSPL